MTSPRNCHKSITTVPKRMATSKASSEAYGRSHFTGLDPVHRRALCGRARPRKHCAKRERPIAYVFLVARRYVRHSLLSSNFRLSSSRKPTVDFG